MIKPERIQAAEFLRWLESDGYKEYIERLDKLSEMFLDAFSEGHDEALRLRDPLP